MPVTGPIIFCLTEHMCAFPSKTLAVFILFLVYNSYGENGVTSVSAELVTITTGLGNITGLNTSIGGQNVYIFKRIPFAKPPTGPRRFQKPEPFGNWTGVLNATAYGPSCMQYILGNDKAFIPNTAISEDCLQLNIYVPRTLEAGGNRSVMVWVHGGGFTAGQATLFDGSYLALTGDVIVVTINYRLNVFGFMSTGDTVVKGNYGLWDQNLAIKWVKDNIGDFGGDGESITIFGESAGGISVGYQSVSPHSKGLFKRVISESGVQRTPMSTANQYNFTLSIGRLLGCNSTRSTYLIECMRNKAAMDVLNAWNNASRSTTGDFNLGSPTRPVVDNDFLPDSTNDFLVKLSAAFKVFSSVDLMAGTNNADGGLMYFYMIPLQSKYKFDISAGIPAAVLCDLVGPALANYYHKDKVSDAVCSAYTIPNGTLQEQGRSICNVYGDFVFTMPTIQTVSYHSNATSKRTYQYLFSHQPSRPWIQARPSWLIGANHADDLPFVWGLDVLYPTNASKPSAERRLSEQIMKYWTNFAKTGNPNDADLLSWPQYDDINRRYMNLKQGPTVQQNLYPERRKLWLETIPNLLRQSSGDKSSSSRIKFTLNWIRLSVLIMTIVKLQ